VPALIRWISGPDDRSVAEAVAVLEGTVQHMVTISMSRCAWVPNPFPGATRSSLITRKARKSTCFGRSTRRTRRCASYPASRSGYALVQPRRTVIIGDSFRAYISPARGRETGLDTLTRPQRTRMTQRTPSLLSCASWSFVFFCGAGPGLPCRH
jgi:hypothetical protein